MNRGEVWLVNLDPTIGAEIEKTRPCVIVGRNALARLPLKIIVPLTEWDDAFSNFPWHVRVNADALNNLNKDSSADTYQVRSMDASRLVQQIGAMDTATMEQINIALSLSLDLI